MGNKLKEKGRYKITILLMVMSVFCIGLSIARYWLTGTKLFLFLNWNLFLAIIPWLLSTWVLVKEFNNKIWLFLLIVVWLLFFPNSPYILTDLFHLRLRRSAPIWFDFIMIFSFAWTGLMFGFVSLMDIISLLKKYLREWMITVLTVLFFFLSSFGIYLGRYLRWNSWDVVNNPQELMDDVTDRFTDPFSHPQTWGMTILMGFLLNVMFYSIQFLREEKK